MVTSPRSQPFAPRVVPVGDAAVMLELADAIDLAANERAQRVAAMVRVAEVDGVTDVVGAIATVTVHFSALTADQARSLRARLHDLLLTALHHAPGTDASDERPPVAVPVCYDAAFAPDLADVATATGLSADEVVRLHVASQHRVLMMGFAPGFAYIGGLDARLAVPRRPTPRARLDAGSVAIAAGQTAVYPFATPGGWNVIGRTPLAMFDPAREPPSVLQAGDRVAFVPIDAAAFARMASEAASAAGRPPRGRAGR
ncbi:MAG: allophanate hydrolase [Betaproteobacteria bacterium]|nr:MAG: allophanate hydrolase [Betaproteobacteria bacterium]